MCWASHMYYRGIRWFRNAFLLVVLVLVLLLFHVGLCACGHVMLYSSGRHLQLQVIQTKVLFVKPGSYCRTIDMSDHWQCRRLACRVNLHVGLLTPRQTVFLGVLTRRSTNTPHQVILVRLHIYWHFGVLTNHNTRLAIAPGPTVHWLFRPPDLPSKYRYNAPQ